MPGRTHTEANDQREQANNDCVFVHRVIFMVGPFNSEVQRGDFWR
jgi:hypothetical protein